MVTDRLEHPELKKIIVVLKMYSSSYLVNFEKFKTRIDDGFNES
jgi:hypothetical protein